MPEGQPRRCVDTSRANEWLGFRAETKIAEGIRAPIAWYRGHYPGGARWCFRHQVLVKRA